MTLHFAEISHRWLNHEKIQRVFDVSIEGKGVLTDYNITESVGAATAEQKSFEAEVDDGVLDIEFHHRRNCDSPKISAIEIETLSNE